MRALGAALLVAGIFAASAVEAAETDPPVAPAAAENAFEERWQGAYVVGLAGQGWANMFTTQSSGLGWVGGMAVGYNRQQGRMVLGLEFDGMWSGREGTFYDVPWSSYLRLTWGVGGKRLHFYGAAGAAAMHVNNTLTAPFSSTEFGWNVGGGLDIGLGKHFMGRVEYVYARYGDLNGTNLMVATHEVRGGWGTRF